MNPLALAIIGQLRAISEATSQVHWRAEELQAMSSLLHQAAGNVEQAISRRQVTRKRNYPDQGGAA
ncbi:MULTISPECIES: hypothetical protein [unclassified Bradyrhizobium]|uniref:hypothetical protein n=1 Tax=unclassified Bradyrhizobium TaxID=2631580 RepID=UPI0024796745|nr:MULTISPECIES: hypothetical protein [unclassified Bradyrhizobium]WGR67832.1 hypothetical protein MTX24_20400 [Bradyrhizobium sp. ISRA426]WGR79885.1 hypothetical protein MTX21_05515 [Bradyrhizobium sp. ISRA430]WGR83071.1 hypothetical protein MTX25_20080 [Bradyrhizobium sp. ISRA432]